MTITLEDWVNCDLRKYWFHCACLGIEASFTRAIDYFHCDTCVESHLIPFLRYYLSYHAIDGINIINKSNTEIFTVYGR